MTTKNLRLAGPALLTNAAATKYTAPSATVTKISHIHVENPSGGSTVNFTMSIGTDAAGTRVYDAYPIASGTVLSIFVNFVLQPAEIVQAFGSTTNILTLTLDGQELTAG